MALGSIKNYKPWLFIVPLILFVIDCFLVQTGIIASLDILIYQGLHSFESVEVTKVVIMITHLGSFLGILGVIILIFAFSKRIAWNCLIVSFLQQLINRLLKFIFKRPRPDVVHLVVETNYSFPSGHAMAVSCLYALIIYYLYHSNLSFRYILIGLSVIIIIAVDLSRVYLGVHYFSDVLGGTMLSISLVLYLCNKTFFIA